MEAFHAAVKFKLYKLVVIVYRNHVQLDDTTEKIMPIPDFSKVLKVISWRVRECDGHDVYHLLRIVQEAQAEPAGPNIIVVETVKGKGIFFMEGQYIWHGKALSQDDYRGARKELDELVF